MDLAEMEPFTESKPAPEPLVAVQAFANTLDVESDTDLLATSEEFRGWLFDCGFAGPDLQMSETDLRHARELRDTIRSQLAANAHGAPDRAAAKSMRTQAGTRPIPVTVDDSGHLELDL